MALNQTHLGHFINQLTLSAAHFGFSVQDSNTLESQMNARYNVRCQPAVTTNPAFGPQLFSLCQAETCPLAAPVADCDAYVDLGPTGPARSSGTTSSNSSQTQSSPGQTATVTTTHSSSATPAATTSAAPSSSNTLAAGPIAGIAIGGAAVVLGFIGLIVFLLRRRRNANNDIQAPHPGFGGPPSNPSYINSPYSGPASPYGGYPHSPVPTDAHTSYMSNPIHNPHAELWTPPPVEIGSGNESQFQKSPDMVQTKTKVL